MEEEEEKAGSAVSKEKARGKEGRVKCEQPMGAH
jgi:hypothetical protein